ncbi:MAG: hypothetical protein KHZ15_02720 [Coprobacillus cateniformis]|uniref:hypothetical protein n=1 Tax=Longibaculum muris TaxID=1796628 RepID=UPI003AB3722E|nr:hypothetical protein [Coprobacillus cateniformis]
MSSELEKLCKLNNNLDEKISKENQPLFTDMICYIRSANISALSQEMVRRDLSEMIISAQNRGENINDVIGGDLKEFCDEVISNLSPKTVKEKWIDRLDIFCSCMPILGTISIVFSSDFREMINNMISNQPINYNIGVSVGMIISICVIMIAAIFIVDRITKNALKKESDSNRSKRVIIGSVMGAILMILFIIIWKLGNQILFNINIFLVITVLVGFFIVHKMLCKI